MKIQSVKLKGPDESTGIQIKLENGSILSVPNSMDNRHWRRYLEWKAEGNTPDPQFTQAELEARALTQEINDLRSNLRNNDYWLFRMVLALFGALQAKGVLTANEVDSQEPGVKAKAQAWKQKLNRLKEIND